MSNDRIHGPLEADAGTNSVMEEMLRVRKAFAASILGL